MSDRSELLPRIIEWLDEVGVAGSTADTAVSSLNLVWITHRFEELTGSPVGDRASELAGADTVGELAEVLGRMR